MKIGVFDSGIGGLSVANAIKRAVPKLEVVVKEDKKHLPYGNRTPEELLGFVTPIFQELVDEGCQVIVVACNTVSTTLMPQLKAIFDIPFVALVPMVKPAASLTKTGVIAVCATPTTLASPRYKELKQEFSKGIQVLEPDCSDWVYMIEHSDVDEEKISQRVGEVINQKADVIVLACTHYHWIEDIINILSKGRATVIQPEQAIIKQLQTVIAELALQP